MKTERKLRRSQPQQDLAAALQTLRLLIKEVGGNYLAGLQADAAQVQLVVKAMPAKTALARKRTAELRRMLRWINSLDVKPGKGRRRDLKEIDRIVSRLRDVADNW